MKHKVTSLEFEQTARGDGCTFRFTKLGMPVGLALHVETGKVAVRLSWIHGI